MKKEDNRGKIDPVTVATGGRGLNSPHWTPMGCKAAVQRMTHMTWKKWKEYAKIPLSI